MDYNNSPENLTGSMEIKIENIEDETFLICYKIIPIGKTFKQTILNKIYLI